MKLVYATIKNYIASFFILFVFMTNLYFVMLMKDKMQLMVLGLSYAVMNLISTSFAQGLNNALTTLIAQAFGASQSRKISLYYQRGFYL